MIRLRFDSACLVPCGPLRPASGRPSENRHEMHEVVVAGAVRTPIGKFGGALVAADRGPARRRRGPRSAVPRGHRAGAGRRGHLRLRAPGRGRPQRRPPDRLPRRACPRKSPAYTVNMACGSGLKALAPRVQGGPRRRRRRGPGRRHGVHEPRALPADRRALGLPDGPPGGGGRHVPGRLPVPARRAAHGRDRGDAGRDVRDHPRGAGRVRAAQPGARRAGRSRRAASTPRSCP